MLVKYIENNDIVVSSVIRCDIVRAIDEDGNANGHLLRFFTSDYGDVVICRSSYSDCIDILNELYEKDKVDLSCNANFEVMVANVFSPELLALAELNTFGDDIDIDVLDPDDDTDFDDEY